MLKQNSIMIGIGKKIIFYIALIAIWGMVYKLGVDWLGFWKSYIFPAPWDVGKTLVSLFHDQILEIAILASLKRILLGYLLSLVLGIAMGLIMVRVKYLDENLSSLFLGMQTLPSICWLPFAVLWFGLNESAIIFVITIGSTFAMSIATQEGIKNINPLYLRAASTMGAKGWKYYWNVTVPAALPSLVAGMKQGWSFAWRGLMAGEILQAPTGLGQILVIGRELADISQVMAVMLVILLLGLAVEQLIFRPIENNIRTRWGLNN